LPRYEEDALELHLQYGIAKQRLSLYVDSEFLGSDLAARYQDPHSVDL